MKKGRQAGPFFMRRLSVATLSGDYFFSSVFGASAGAIVVDGVVVVSVEGAGVVVVVSGAGVTAGAGAGSATGAGAGAGASVLLQAASETANNDATINDLVFMVVLP